MGVQLVLGGRLSDIQAYINRDQCSSRYPHIYRPPKHDYTETETQKQRSVLILTLFPTETAKEFLKYAVFQIT